MPGSVSSPRGSRTSGDVPANVSRRSASLTSRSSSVHGPHLSCSGRYRNGSSESSAARRRLRRTRCSLKRSYTAHACRFSPYRPPSAAMLDPFPNASINSLCVVGLSTLLTVHRTGVRLYRQRQLPAPAPPSTLNMLASRPSSNAAVPSASPAAVPHGVCEATGVFELIETRHEFQVRESYLCAAMQPVVVNGSLFLSKWSRYFCVASGSDRIVHGVSVMSSGAHFCLNHTQHQTSKVVCMQCTQLALEPCHPLSLTPAVVSVDEVGVVVLFDIEREVASVLEQAPLWYRQTDARPREKGAAADPSHVTNSTRDSGGHAGSGLHQAPLQQQHLTPEEEDHVLNTIEKAAMSERVVYHLEHGVATRVALVGPCVELCNRCHNAFSRSMSSSRGYKLVSLYLCSRARDVPADATPPEHLGDGEGGGAAELNVVLLRVLWGPRRAFVLEEVHLLHEVAPTDVCDVGIAMNSPPYEVGMPMTLLLARPALELWKLRGCTGDLIETCRVYAANSDGPRCGSCRDASECFLQWVPLGRHRLIVEKATEIEEENSWSCTVAMTNNDTVLLLGSAPMPVNRDALGKTALVAASPVGDQGISTTRKELAAEPFKDTDLEAWLDDISVPASRSSSLPAAESSLTAPAAANCTGPPAAESTATDDDGDNDGVSAACHAVTFPYTVLMELYAPQRSYSSRTRESASAVSTVLLSVMPDWTANRLLLFMEDQETLLSVPLPFLERVVTLTDAKQHEADGREGTGVAAGPSIPTSGVDDLLPSTSTAQNPHVVSQETQPGRMIQYFKSASTHLWGPSAPSHFFHLDASGGEVTRAPPVLSAPPTEAHTSPADDRSAAQFSDAAAVSSSATAAAGSREPYRFFSLTRPLMAALFHLSGEHEEPASLAVVEAPLKDPVTSVTGDAKAPGIALSTPPIQQAGNGVIGSPPACPSPLTVSADGERSGTQHRCRRGSSSESSRAGSSRYRRTRKPQRIGNGAPASSAEAAHTVIIEEGAAARASYISAQIALLKEEPKAQRGSRTSETGVIADEDHGAQHEAATTVSQWQYALRRVAEVEEPLERNALLYAWKDGHNDLYIHFSVELDELRQREAADEEDGHAVPLSRRGETGSISPDASRHSRGTARPRLTLCRPADVEDGIHSMGFLSQYNAVVHRRAATASYGNCFDFSSYFVTLQVPQHVLDVQERDKYRLELEDLRLQQARDLASLHPYDMVTIFQNEERVSAKDAAWRLHATFPYDDAQDGHAVDLQQLNRTAVRDPAAAAASEWRWADASEARAWSKEHDLARSSTNRVRSLVKDLKDWEVGPWAYATRWPSREEELRGDDGFIWSASEAPEHTCRRRRLSRLRVSIAELKRQTELMASHQRELEELREALGL
ncbi:hypothetical protein, conserved [Leishmania donovani]|uniref:Uncharacterized protein n=1 Tax=Leishmania donovani TaxID=5661 RepID=E9BMG4_LEIDO|nr:hypothetical protein, conserved [Leishmania donovani]AYU81220.1 hypothetical protein LdCL_310009100 [Leishmania donovani]CBZ36442.1 hypothetical protein, conserved [Leishmania donovani]